MGLTAKNGYKGLNSLTEGDGQEGPKEGSKWILRGLSQPRLILVTSSENLHGWLASQPTAPTASGPGRHP